MPTLYLHIGPHKTGSTYLQYAFSQQADVLEKHGVAYPAIGREYIYGHHNIAYWIIERELVNTTREKLSAQLEELAQLDANILLSSEHFSSISAAKIATLQNFFPRHAFHIIYVARKGSGFIYSLWQQMIRAGTTTALNQLDPQAVTHFFKYNPCDHAETLGKFTQNLSAATSILDYNDLIAEKKDLVEAVAAIVKVPLLSYKKKVNESLLSIEEVELIRCANLYNQVLKKHKGAEARRYPSMACLKILNTPLLGNAFRSYLKKKMNASAIGANDFINLGFNSSNFSSGEMEKSFNYIAKDILLQELNKDNVLAWQMIKKALIAH